MDEQPKRSRRQWDRFVELNVHKVPEERLIAEMSADGFSEEEIRTLIKRKKQKSLGGYLGLMVTGVVLALLGYFLTAGSIGAASSGDSYIVFWGAILVGIVTFFIGLFKMLLKK
jgi:hypothetical protein